MTNTDDKGLLMSKDVSGLVSLRSGRSKITWGHKILSFKQCGVIDAPHCFEAS